MRTFGGLLALLVCVGLAVLAILNPQMNDFEEFAARHLKERIAARFEQRAGTDSALDSALGRALAGAGADLASRYIDRLATRENYVVASVYAVDLDGPDADELEWRFLGIGGHFIPLEDPQQQEKDAGNAQRRP